MQVRAGKRPLAYRGGGGISSRSRKNHHPSAWDPRAISRKRFVIIRRRDANMRGSVWRWMRSSFSSARQPRRNVLNSLALKGSRVFRGIKITHTNCISVIVSCANGTLLRFSSRVFFERRRRYFHGRLSRLFYIPRNLVCVPFPYLWAIAILQRPIRSKLILMPSARYSNLYSLYRG